MKKYPFRAEGSSAIRVTVLLAGCLVWVIASADAGTAYYGAAVPIPSEQATLEAQFQAGIKGTMSCEKLYEIRNELKRGKPEAYQNKLNDQLKSVGCTFASAKRPAKQPTSQSAAPAAAGPKVKYASCDELRSHANKLYDLLERTGARSWTPAYMERNRDKMSKWHEEFTAISDGVPASVGTLERPGDLLYATAGLYATTTFIAKTGSLNREGMKVQLELCGEELAKMEATFSSARCSLK